MPRWAISSTARRSQDEAVSSRRQSLAMVSGANKTPLLAESETSFYISNTNLRVEFIRDATGAVTEMVLQQGTRQDRARRR